MRAQTSLVTVAVGLLLLTTAGTLGVVLADEAIGGATRDPGERRVAVSLAGGLVAEASPLSARPNVLNASALERLNETTLAAAFPVVDDAAVTVRLDDRTLVAGDTDGGTTVRRIVLVRREQRRQLTPSFSAGRNVTLPRRTDRVRLGIAPNPGASVTTVRSNGRVVLHDPGGLNGSYTAAVSRFETVRLRFAGNGSLAPGSVEITYFPAQTRKAVLAVTADA